jgi:zinc protease
MRLLIAFAGIWLAVAGICPAQDLKPIATVEGVSEYKLSNGARVLLFPDASRPTITVNMTVLVGSRHEGYGEAGMAHLLEHMVFKGTPTFRDVPKALRDHGASFNGTTNSDRTNYFETLPASDENLDFAIHLESDRLVNSFVRREDLISEFTVVRNEFERGENSPQGVLSQRVQAVAYEWHNYGKSTIGNRSDIERVPIDNLQDFYRKFYQPDNVVLIVTGAFEEKKALSIIQKYLGAIPKPTRRLDPTYTEEPPQDGERNVTLRRVGKIGSISVAYHMPAASHPDWAPLEILGSVLSEAKIGRLTAALVETKKATGISARADESHDPGLFFVSAEPAESTLEQLRDELLSILDNLGTTPFGEEEVKRAKVRYNRMSEVMLSSASSMSQVLSSSSALGDWRLFFLQRDRIAAVTVEDLNRVAKQYFPAHNRTVGLFIPSDVPLRSTIPAVESIADVVKDYRGGDAIASGEAFDPSPANIDARTKVIEHEGLKIALLEKKNRGSRVSMALTLHYGNEESLSGKTTAAGILGAMLMAGTKTMDRQVLQERMDAMGVSISAGGGGGRGRGGRGGGGGGGRAGALSFSIDAKRESLVQGIYLLGDILRDPGFPESEFEQMKLRTVNRMQSMQSDPTALASDKLGRALSPYPASDPRFVPTTAESIQMIETLTLDQVIGIYKDQLSTAVGEVSIVGDFDSAEAVTAIKEILKNWKSEIPYRSIDREAIQNLAGSKENIITPDKANAVFLAGLSFAMNEKDDPSTALQIGNFILGGGTLSSRLGDRIRQKEGLSYGVTSSISIPSRGNDARFTINAITNPSNMNAVEKAAFEELVRFITDGPTEQELADAQKAFLESEKVSRTGDSAIAGQLVSNLHLGRTFAYTAEREKRVLDLKIADIQAAFKKYIDPEKLTVLRAGDLK